MAAGPYGPLETGLLLGLELSRRLYHIQFPTFLQREVDDRRRVLDEAAELIIGVLQRHTGNQAAAYQHRVWLQTAMCDTVATKLRYSGYSAAATYVVGRDKPLAK